MSTGTVEETIGRLRKELIEAHRLGVTEGATSGAMQQLVLQLVQECDRRRADCVKQADSLRTQAAAAEAQSHAFSVIGSIACAILHGFNSQAQKALDEEAARAAKKAEAEAEAEAEAKAKSAESALSPDSGSSENSDDASKEEPEKPKKHSSKKK